jgi:hypothetical protein
MRFPLIAAVLVALPLIACTGPATPTSDMGPENVLIETSEYTGVIFSKEEASQWSFLFDEATTELWRPSVSDVSRTEECIRRFLVSAPSDPNLAAYEKEDAAFVLENLAEYRRQYVGLIVEGEKRIWCNAFSPDESFPDWELDPVYVLDGGRDFWEIEYILDKDECVRFHVHGEA